MRPATVGNFTGVGTFKLFGAHIFAPGAGEGATRFKICPSGYCPVFISFQSSISSFWNKNV